jgi:hypothetical protein
LTRLFKSEGKQEDGSNDGRNVQNGESSKIYRKNYIDVNYYFNKKGPEFIDVLTEELTTQKPPLDISVDRIIDTPRRKCPNGQKIDLFGTCKTVWEN